MPPLLEIMPVEARNTGLLMVTYCLWNTFLSEAYLVYTEHKSFSFPKLLTDVLYLFCLFLWFTSILRAVYKYHFKLFYAVFMPCFIYYFVSYLKQMFVEGVHKFI